MKTVISSISLVLMLVFFFNACSDIEGLKYVRNDRNCPIVSGISHEGAPFDTIVTLTGDHFYSRNAADYEILIGGTAISQESIVDVPDENTLRFKVPKGCPSGNLQVRLVEVVCNDESGSGVDFTYYYTATEVTTLIDASNCGGNCLAKPLGIDIDKGGNLWVADEDKNSVYKINQAGSIIDSIGKSAQTNCNTGTSVSKASARFNKPSDVAIDASTGDIFVADQFHSYIRKILVQGSDVQRFAGQCGIPGSLNGTCGDDSLFLSPYCLERDGANLYILDDGRIRIVDASCSVRLFSANIGYVTAMKVSDKRSGAGPVIAIDTDTKKIYSFNSNGIATQIVLDNNTMNSPSAIEIDTRGNIFISDKATHQILIAYTNGHVRPLAGVYNGPGFLNNAGSSTFRSPSGLVLGNSEGLLYISDTGNKAIRKVIFQ